MVQILLVLEVLFTQDSEVEDLFCGASSGSEPSLFFSNYFFSLGFKKSRKENPQKLTQLSSRSHPRHLVGKRTAQKDTTTDTTSDSQVNSNLPHRRPPASLTFNNYFYLFLCPRDESQGALRFAPVCPSVCLSVRPFVTLYGIEFV